MPDILYLISRWWKQVLLVMIIAVITAAVILFFQPVRFLSVATALPGNPAMTDKASIFNTNIQTLSSSLGAPDELDIIVGSSQLDTAYLAVAEEFNIWDHYKTEGNKEDLLNNSAMTLKKNSRVIKSDFGELKVKVWDSDKNLAPQLANAIMEKLNAIHRDIQNKSNETVLHKLKADRDSLLTKADDKTNSVQADKLRQYEELITQYQLIVDSNPSPLMIVERARPATKPDRPEQWLVLVVTAFAGLLFGLLLALVMERRKTKLS